MVWWFSRGRVWETAKTMFHWKSKPSRCSMGPSGIPFHSLQFWKTGCKLCLWSIQIHARGHMHQANGQVLASIHLLQNSGSQMYMLKDLKLCCSRWPLGGTGYFQEKKRENSNMTACVTPLAWCNTKRPMGCREFQEPFGIELMSPNSFQYAFNP